MSTAERLAFSIREQAGGVHILLWEEKEDLVHTLLVLLAALGEDRILSILLSSADSGIQALRRLVDTRQPIEEDASATPKIIDAQAQKLWVLFVQQASTRRVGPWLNGWRRPISDQCGSLLVVRSPDFEAFQRSAPDLSSFAGPRIYDSSSMLSMVSGEISKQAKGELPEDIMAILKELPGSMPSSDEIKQWLVASMDYANNTLSN